VAEETADSTVGEEFDGGKLLMLVDDVWQVAE
jgi:hypothetical protein